MKLVIIMVKKKILPNLKILKSFDLINKIMTHQKYHKNYKMKVYYLNMKAEFKSYKKLNLNKLRIGKINWI